MNPKFVPSAQLSKPIMVRPTGPTLSITFAVRLPVAYVIHTQ